MNIFDNASGNEAKIRYLDSDYRILSPGTHVYCAVTGKRIDLEDLKYWSVERQEAYADVKASFSRERQLAPKLFRA